MREIQVSDTHEEPGKSKYQHLTPCHCTTPPNVCFHIATSNPDIALICCRAGTRPVIDLDLFYAPVRPHAKTERPPKKPTAGLFFSWDKLKAIEEASVSIVLGSRQGTLQQLVWIIRRVGGSRLGEVEGRCGDSWRQDRASRSGRMTITKILAGSHSPGEGGVPGSHRSQLQDGQASGWPWGECKCVREGRSYFHFLSDSPFLSLRNIEKHHFNDCLLKWPVFFYQRIQPDNCNMSLTLTLLYTFVHFGEM